MLGFRSPPQLLYAVEINGSLEHPSFELAVVSPTNNELELITHQQHKGWEDLCLALPNKEPTLWLLNDRGVIHKSSYHKGQRQSLGMLFPDWNSEAYYTQTAMGVHSLCRRSHWEKWATLIQDHQKSITCLEIGLGALKHFTKPLAGKRLQVNGLLLTFGEQQLDDVQQNSRPAQKSVTWEYESLPAAAFLAFATALHFLTRHPLSSGRLLVYLLKQRFQAQIPPSLLQQKQQQTIQNTLNELLFRQLIRQQLKWTGGCLLLALLLVGGQHLKQENQQQRQLQFLQLQNETRRNDSLITWTQNQWEHLSQKNKVPCIPLLDPLFRSLPKTIQLNTMKVQTNPDPNTKATIRCWGNVSQKNSLPLWMKQIEKQQKHLSTQLHSLAQRRNGQERFELEIRWSHEQ